MSVSEVTASSQSPLRPGGGGKSHDGSDLGESPQRRRRPSSDSLLEFTAGVLGNDEPPPKRRKDERRAPAVSASSSAASDASAPGSPSRSGARPLAPPPPPPPRGPEPERGEDDRRGRERPGRDGAGGGLERGLRSLLDSYPGDRGGPPAAPTIAVVYSLQTVIRRTGEVDLPCESPEKALYVKVEGPTAHCAACGESTLTWTSLPTEELPTYLEFATRPSAKETLATKPGARRVLIDATKLHIVPCDAWCLKVTLPLGDLAKESVYRYENFCDFAATTARVLDVARLAQRLTVSASTAPTNTKLRRCESSAT